MLVAAAAVVGAVKGSEVAGAASSAAVGESTSSTTGTASAAGDTSVSLAGTAGTISFSFLSVGGLVPSFLPKKLPKTDPRFVGLGAESVAMVLEPATAAAEASVGGTIDASVVEPSAFRTGSSITRAAGRIELAKAVKESSNFAYRLQQH